MGEINGPKINVNQVSFNSVQKQGQEIPAESIEKEAEEPKLKDFSDPKAESLGRSMLIKDADNVNHDLKTLMDNPQVAENSDKMFEASFKAAQDAGIEHPYEEAASFSTGNV